MVSHNHKEDLEQTKKLIMNVTNKSNYSWGRIEESKKRDNIHIEKKNELLLDFLIFEESHVKDLLEENKFEPDKEKKYRVFLPPIEKTECLALLTFTWDYYGQNWKWKFILDIAKSCHEILSLRFETQHSDGGTHDHLHMQINNKFFGSARCEEQYKLEWLPRECPHLLLRSDKHQESPVILLVYLLGSLYGFKDATKFLDGIDLRYTNDMEDYFS